MRHSTEIQISSLQKQYANLSYADAVEAREKLNQSMIDSLLEGREYMAIRLAAFISTLDKDIALKKDTHHDTK